MRAIFLDVDGVLNRHVQHSNGYCGIDRDLAENLNLLLESCPDAQLVISSSWRYCVHNGDSTLKGLEHLLLTHGINCYNRVHGITEKDGHHFTNADHEPPFDKEFWRKQGLLWRVDQIRNYVKDHGITSYVVLDDLPLEIENFVCTATVEERNGILLPVELGLTKELAAEAQRTLEEGEK